MLVAQTFLFIIMKLQETKLNNLLLGNRILYLLAVHVRLGTSSYLSQLLDLFGYEAPIKTRSIKRLNKKKNQAFVLFYNFHNLLQHTRQFLTTAKTMALFKIKSLTDLFPNANWLERELSELFGIIFEGKNDTRNLMLQYGDTTNPFLKYFPSVGVREAFYNALLDLLQQPPLNVGH